MVRVGLLLGMAVTTCALPAAAKREPRSGFTIEAGGGGGLYRQTVDDASLSAPAFSFGLGLGAFITPSVALMYRQHASYAMRSRLPGFSYNGLALQWWPTTSFFVSGGAGFVLQFPFGIVREQTLGSLNPYGEVRFGGAINARIGFAFIDSPHHNVRVALEAIPMFVPNGSALAGALLVEWQYL